MFLLIVILPKTENDGSQQTTGRALSHITAPDIACLLKLFRLTGVRDFFQGQPDWKTMNADLLLKIQAGHIKLIPINYMKLLTHDWRFVRQQQQYISI